MADRQRDPALVAWAAGLYDGEGSCSAYLPKFRKTYRRQMAVSQGGDSGTPPTVLLRFRNIVGGHGNITGPYRGYLYYWKTSRKLVIDEIVQLLWPEISPEKRQQYLEACELARIDPEVNTPQTTGGPTDVAWAAGFFDGEGTVGINRLNPTRAPYRGVEMEIPQSSDDGVPKVLLRFKEVVGRGSITGPHEPRNPWSQLPSYRWRLGGHLNVEATAGLLWPWLSAVRRIRIEWALGEVHAGLKKRPHQGES